MLKLFAICARTGASSCSMIRGTWRLFCGVSTGNTTRFLAKSRGDSRQRSKGSKCLSIWILLRICFSKGDLGRPWFGNTRSKYWKDYASFTRSTSFTATSKVKRLFDYIFVGRNSALKARRVLLFLFFIRRGVVDRKQNANDEDFCKITQFQIKVHA